MDIAKQRIEQWIAIGNVDSSLDLSHLGLTELPDIPTECKEFWCFNNNLTTIPYLPNCIKLCCSSNELTVLPELPSCEDLRCFHNNIESLPKLPKCRLLFCFDNKLVTLPDLPKCEVLHCDNNNLVVLPNLPKCHTLFSGGNKYLHETFKQCKKHNLLPNTNYSMFAAKIQKAYRKYKQMGVFVELHKMYIKNMAMLISQYI